MFGKCVPKNHAHAFIAGLLLIMYYITVNSKMLLHFRHGTTDRDFLQIPGRPSSTSNLECVAIKKSLKTATHIHEPRRAYSYCSNYKDGWDDVPACSPKPPDHSNQIMHDMLWLTSYTRFRKTRQLVLFAIRGSVSQTEELQRGTPTRQRSTKYHMHQRALVLLHAPFSIRF